VCTLTSDVKRIALDAGADLVGIAPISRFDDAPESMHPRTIFSKTESVIALGCRMLRGALKTIEEGNYWQAYNCDSYQYLNEVPAPRIGWDPRYSPFLKKDSRPENPPTYYEWLDTRFRHHTICGGRGCIRKCMDHLEKTGRIQKQYRTPMVEGRQWVIEEPLE
jgi:hypothetical protein